MQRRRRTVARRFRLLERIREFDDEILRGQDRGGTCHAQTQVPALVSESAAHGLKQRLRLGREFRRANFSEEGIGGRIRRIRQRVMTFLNPLNVFTAPPPRAINAIPAMMLEGSSSVIGPSKTGAP